jgi:hypothetical protein
MKASPDIAEGQTLAGCGCSPQGNSILNSEVTSGRRDVRGDALR